MDDRCSSGPGGYASRLIKFKARQLSRQHGFSSSDEEDLAQEMRTDLEQRLPRYNASKAALSTFVARVVERKIASILRHHRAEMRSPAREEYSLNEPVLDLDGREVERHQTTPEVSRDDGRRRDMERDIAAVLALLEDEDRAIALGLAFGTVNSVAEELGIPRTAVARRIAAMREVFRDAGLDAYL